MDQISAPWISDQEHTQRFYTRVDELGEMVEKRVAALARMGHREAAIEIMNNWTTFMVSAESHRDKFVAAAAAQQPRAVKSAGRATSRDVSAPVRPSKRQPQGIPGRAKSRMHPPASKTEIEEEDERRNGIELE